MTPDRIISIRYDKERGEYIINRRTAAGERTRTFANHLSDECIGFTQSCSNIHEDRWSIIYQ